MTRPESELEPEPRRARSVMEATPKVSSRARMMDPAGERREDPAGERREKRRDRGEREGRDRDRVRRRDKQRSRS